MKYALVHRALGFKAALLAQIAERQLNSNQGIIVSFQQQEATILRQAQTTEECLQLSKDIADAELQLKELRETIAFSRDIDEFLEKYRCDVLRVCSYLSPFDPAGSRNCHTRNNIDNYFPNLIQV